MKIIFLLLGFAFSLVSYANNSCQDYCSDYSGKAKGACIAGCSMGCQSSTETSNDDACVQIEASFEKATGTPAPWLNDIITGIGDYCGGITGAQCVSGLTCADNPNDICDPANGGADCAGVCIDETQGMVCPYEGIDITQVIVLIILMAVARATVMRKV